MIEPTGKNIVLTMKEKKKKLGIILADSVGEKMRYHFIIAATGPDVNKQFKKGKKVIFADTKISQVELDGEKYIVAHEEDVVALY